MAKLHENLAALATMSPAQLRAEWLRTFRTPPPAIGHRLLAMAVAHRIQEKAYGGLSTRHVRELARLAAQYRKTGAVTGEVTATLKVGSRLIRNWHGIPHQVLIRDDGYVYRDKVYGSLSHVAREITGTNWSGPRFFGLTKQPSGRCDLPFEEISNA